MNAIHRIVGFTIVSGWGLLFLSGVALWVRKRDAGRIYWGLLTVLQVLLGLQLLAGLWLLISGGQRPFLHYMYGAVFPALVVGIAHWFTRGLEKPPYHVFFTIASFFVLGLTLSISLT